MDTWSFVGGLKAYSAVTIISISFNSSPHGLPKKIIKTLVYV